MKNNGTMRMSFLKRKWWLFPLIVMLFSLIILIVIISNYYIGAFAEKSIALQKQEVNRLGEAAEQATISRASVCTKDGKSVPKQEGSSLYMVPADAQRIYVCGFLEISTPYPVTIYLSQKGDAFTSSSAMLNKGSFIMDVIAADALQGGIYRADLYIIRGKSAASVDFFINK